MVVQGYNLNTWETEARGPWIWGVSGLHKNTLSQKTKHRFGDVAQVVEYLPSKCEALSSNHSTAKKKKCSGILSNIVLHL
jgi:hypothetical protein